MAVAAGQIALSFDVGGTFTDFVAVDVFNGRVVAQHKVLTNSVHPDRGVMRGWREIVATGIDAAAVVQCVHSTTLVTNALIERKGARTALLTTAGFRDILELGREQMYDIYDLFAPMPAPLIPRPLRFELDERIDAHGTVLKAPTPAAIAAAIEQLRDADVQAVAVAFLHAYRNPTHEIAVAEAIAAALPDVEISLSSAVAPIVGEFERTSTAASDAFTKPAVRRYVQGLQDALVSSGVTAELHLMLSSGEIASAATARAHPIRLLESGPAAGAIAAAFYGKLAGFDDVLSLDMGGTTAKACVIEGGRPELTHMLEVARERRFMAGSGFPVVTPVVDLIEIGAGGGSIARRDELGLLKVGPDSAGADPGPACYGLGGELPTVSDANLVLGYLNPGNFLGGAIPLSVDLARAAVGRLGAELGLDVEATAAGIHRVVNENMAAAARVHIIERNRDPRSLTTIAFGGAGPAHAVAVARILGSPTVVFPPGAGVASAFGALVAPISFTAGRTLMTRLDRADWHALNVAFAQLAAEASEAVIDAGAPADQLTVRRWAEMRLEGQYHEISVDLPAGELSAASLPAIRAEFQRVYAQQYGRVLEGLEIEGLHWRLNVQGPERGIGLQREEPTGDMPIARQTRDVWFDGAYRSTNVYDRSDLQPGMSFTGPAIIEEREATAVVGPDDTIRVDAYGSLIVQLDGANA